MWDNGAYGVYGAYDVFGAYDVYGACWGYDAYRSDYGMLSVISIVLALFFLASELLLKLLVLWYLRSPKCLWRLRSLRWLSGQIIKGRQVAQMLVFKISARTIKTHLIRGIWRVYAAKSRIIEQRFSDCKTLSFLVHAELVLQGRFCHSIRGVCLEGHRIFRCFPFIARVSCATERASRC